MQDVAAQGLIWNLPDDGTQVKYEGTYEQVINRPESVQGRLTLTWDRNLWIKSVGQETVEFDIDGSGDIESGENTNAWGLDESALVCRWLEFRVETRPPDIEEAPVGTRIYKILVPEAAIRGEIEDIEGVFLSHMPIVKGFRKLGEQPVQELESPAFQLYPLVSLLRHFGELNELAGTQPFDVRNQGSVTAAAVEGEMETESTTSQSNSTATIWYSAEMPFGPVEWEAVVTNKQKNSTEARSVFDELVPLVTLTEKLRAVEVSTGAESDLITE
jgi:hypothetical protein